MKEGVKINKKKKILVLDVETAGRLGYPLVYDIGFAVTDKQGHIYEKHSHCIREIFGDLKRMSSAYYSAKFQNYIELLINKEMKYSNFLDTMNLIESVIKKYRIKVVAAYNLKFDIRALLNTLKHLEIDIDWKMFKLDYLCIWSFACEVLYNTAFIKMALKHGWLTEKGNIKTSAEMGFRYLTKDAEFEEAHQGLDDVLIEVEIMAKCFRQKKKHISGVIPHPWKLVKKRKEVLQLSLDSLEKVC